MAWSTAIRLGKTGAIGRACSGELSRLAALEPVLEDYCLEAPHYLLEALPRARGAELRDILQALLDLKAEAGTQLLPLLDTPDLQNAELMLEILGHSHDVSVGPWLRSWAMNHVAMYRRARSRRQPLPPRRPSVPGGFPYRGVLRALRGHGSPQTESFLVLAAKDWDPTYRHAALGSLGWWEPFRRSEVLACLAQSRRDPSPEVRHRARAALAHLGERMPCNGSARP